MTLSDFSDTLLIITLSSLPALQAFFVSGRQLAIEACLKSYLI
jgi:hypothetical protein